MAQSIRPGLIGALSRLQIGQYRSVPAGLSGYVGDMGQESASYFLPVDGALDAEVVAALRGGGAESGPPEDNWLDLRLQSAYRYWIDLRLHPPPRSLLEVRIALTNDEWSIRAPLEAAFAGLPAPVAERSLVNEEGTELGAPAEEGWSMRLEDDYRRRRAQFVERVGEFTAPISADHVYLYMHQTGSWRDDDRALEWARDREISRIEEMWDPPSGNPGVPLAQPDAERSQG
jgi:hypothetical protein